jgi:hypothetical protein
LELLSGLVGTNLPDRVDILAGIFNWNILHSLRVLLQNIKNDRSVDFRICCFNCIIVLNYYYFIFFFAIQDHYPHNFTRDNRRVKNYHFYFKLITTFTSKYT